MEMREILFRGKRETDGEWVEGYYQKRYDDFENIQNLIFWAKSSIVWEYAEVDPETVCQYTGLTDKNGRKIFEGDIVKDSSCGLYTVNWSNENGMYEVRQYNCSMDSFDVFLACDCEVVGNVFDNFELIGGNAK